MMNPTHADNPGDLSSPNTWGGQPALNSYGYEPLSGYRKALAASALLDPEVVQQLDEFEEGLEPDMEDDQRAKEINKKRQDIADSRIFRPQKAFGSLYSMGRISSEDYVQKLKEFAKSRLGFMEGNERADVEEARGRYLSGPHPPHRPEAN